jgi:hypothetical protein
MVQIQHSFKAAAYRRKAARCDDFSARARSGSDRTQLLQMRDTWLALAAKEDWLDGLPPTPPALAVAQAAHR